MAMRIIFLADVHDDFRMLDTLLQRTGADLYLLGGDLVYRVFPRYETAWRYMELQEILAGHRGPEAETLVEVAARLAAVGQSGALRDMSLEYLRLSERAERHLLHVYERLEELLGRHPHARVHAIAGNYDMDLRKTALKGRDLHLRCIELDGWRIAGYGGARVHTPGIPDHLRVPYREQPKAGRIWSEAHDFFASQKPDIILIHQPAYGHLDRLAGHGHVGSPGIRDYLEEERPELVLSGHLHEDWGGERTGGICFFNPSNFGRVVGVSRVRPGGYFLDLILEAGRFQVATLRRISRAGIYDVVDYRPGNGGMTSLILDEKRYVNMGGRAPSRRHIRSIRQLQRLKSFFLGYETSESRRLIQDLRGVYRRLQREGIHVAFDLLGSLNFGMARRHSDMDLVVYLRGEECIADEMDACAVPRPLAAVFDELKRRDMEVEVCDSLDLDRVERAIQSEDREDGHLQRFIFYRAVCRPVNLRLIKGVENRLLSKEGFRRELEARLREYLRILVSSVRHARSFEKYIARLREAGIKVPPDVEEGIRKYLRGA